MSEQRMDRLERALTRFEIATDRRLSRLENVVGGLENAVGRLAVQVTAFVRSQKDFNATITAAFKTHNHRLDDRKESADGLARTVDRFIRARGNGRDGH
jgi:hypothetical protein